MSGEVRNCGNCGHGQPVPAALGRAVECHGAPPQLVPTPQGLVCLWAQCAPDWWCGVWIAKPVQIFPPATTAKPTEKPTEKDNGKA